MFITYFIIVMIVAVLSLLINLQRGWAGYSGLCSAFSPPLSRCHNYIAAQHTFLAANQRLFNFIDITAFVSVSSLNRVSRWVQQDSLDAFRPVMPRSTRPIPAEKFGRWENNITIYAGNCKVYKGTLRYIKIKMNFKNIKSQSFLQKGYEKRCTFSIWQNFLVGSAGNHGQNLATLVYTYICRQAGEAQYISPRCRPHVLILTDWFSHCRLKVILSLLGTHQLLSKVYSTEYRKDNKFILLHQLLFV